jgi:hypothetical protein
MTHFAPAILSYLGTVDSLETLVRLDHDCKQRKSIFKAQYENGRTKLAQHKHPDIACYLGRLQVFKEGRTNLPWSNDISTRN